MTLIQKLYAIHTKLSDDFSMEEIGVLMFAIMSENGVKYCEEFEIEDEEILIGRDGVEDAFLYVINCEGINFKKFEAACHRFLDFSQQIKPTRASDILDAPVVKMTDEVFERCGRIFKPVKAEA